MRLNHMRIDHSSSLCLQANKQLQSDVERLASRSFSGCNSLIFQRMDPCSVCRNFEVRIGKEQLGSIAFGTKEALSESARRCISCSIVWEAICSFEPTLGRIHSTWVLRIVAGILVVSYNVIANEKGDSRHVRTRLQLYTIDGNVSPWPAIRPLKDLIKDTSSAESIAQVAHWLSQCDGSHSDCSMLGTGEGPTRLLDLSNGQVRLSENPDRMAAFVALSHCWGSFQIIRTLKSNLNEHKLGIRMDRLSKTFQDAVTVTRMLDVRYLWIDSLCIIQDDADDWERESSLMSQVYGNSYVTLLATASVDGRGGLFRKRSGDKESKTIKKRLDDDHEITVRVSQSLQHAPYLNFEISLGDTNLPLLERSWCFQEYILSSRVVHFSEDEILWSCNAGCGCLCGLLPSTLEEKDILKSQVTKAMRQPSDRRDDTYCSSSTLIHAAWWRLVHSYTAKLLTKDGDKLPAISGIAKRVQSYSQDQYIAGLWRSKLADELFWHVVPSSVLKDNILTKVVAHRPKEYRAPSWSWASINAQIQHVGLPGSNNGRSEIIQVECEPAGVDPTGSVRSGRIIVKGVLIPATAWKEEEDFVGDENHCLRHLNQVSSVPDLPWEPDVKEDCENEPDEPLDVAVLWWQWDSQNEASALVLMKTLEENTYKRIGILQTDDVFAGEFDWSEMQKWLEEFQVCIFKIV